ncbi:hypothetical protein ONZ45_g11413 [Pleurotus djamor]|nr:hypothetical protein ONZ45_g11413 [Pleurotus djamor]
MMNLRQLACAAVLLACTLAITAAPVVDMGIDEMDIQAREWDSELDLREYAGDNLLDAYYVNHLVTRAPPKNKPAGPPKRPAPKKTAPKKSAPKKTPPKKAAPKKVPPKKTPPTKATPKTTTPGAPKKPNPKAPSSPSPPGQPGKKGPSPPAKKPAGSPTVKKGKPQTVASCPALPPDGKEKRAPFDPRAECPAVRFTGSRTRLAKVSDQGNSAITYSVVGGWPAEGGNIVAYAKTGLANRPTASFNDEARWLRQIGQLLFAGQVDGRNWIVFAGVSGKVELAATERYAAYFAGLGSSSGVRSCQNWVERKIALVLREVRYYVEQFGVRHADLHSGNILWDQNASQPTLIDWGRAQAVDQWTPELEAQINQELIRAYLAGDNNICPYLR